MKKKVWSDAQDLPDEDLTKETCDLLIVELERRNSSILSLGDGDVRQLEVDGVEQVFN